MQRIRPCLWFDGNAEEAVGFYISIFEDAKITGLTRYEEVGAEVSGRPAGSVMTVTFELEGQEFMALNGGPEFSFTPAISLMVDCRTQAEVDDLWEKLSAGGEPGQCGWLTDQFGVSWQIVPTLLGQLIQDTDPGKRTQVMKALIQMKKIDIGALTRAQQAP